MARAVPFLGYALMSGALFAAGEASADSMNPALSRLVLDHRCHAAGLPDGSHATYLARGGSNVGFFNDDPNTLANLAGGSPWCAPDHVAFKRLVNQWGFAMAPSAMHSARTTGYGGFDISAEGMITKIDSDADYWKLGTRGPRDPNNDRASYANSDPANVLQLYSLKLRKGFGFGLELAASVGFMPNTSILSGGADFRLSLLEGFRTGALGFLPDIAVGSGIRTITGTPEFQLTTVGLDAQISKPLTIASSSQLTPWIGYQYLWIFGDSGLVDLTPATDPVGYCNYAGTNAPGNFDANKPGEFDGQPVCAGGQPTDFNNNVVFDNARLERQRLLFGLNYRYEMVSFGAEFITDLVSPADAQVGSDSSLTYDENNQPVLVSDSEALEGVPRQWTLVLELGAAF